MNALSGTITFPAGLVQVVSVTKGPIIPLWVQDPAYSNTDGTITFGGVVPNPGYEGSGGTVATITFRAISSGTATLRFSNASVLANDGQGTQILTSAPSATVTVGGTAAPTKTTTTTTTSTPAPHQVLPSVAQGSVGPLSLTSPTHPDQNAWYATHAITVSWKNPSSVSQVRTGYDANVIGVPSTLNASPVSSLSFQGRDGITYFHIQVRDSQGWGPISTYRFNIDTVPPSVPVVTFTGRSNPLIQFSATDALSGIDTYQIRLNKDDAVSVSTTTASYQLSGLPRGANTVVVYAVDTAGNQASTSAAVIVLSNGAPAWTVSAWHLLTYSSPVLLLLILLTLMAYFGWSVRDHMRTLRDRSKNR